MKTVVITGAAGFLGKAVVQEFLGKDYRVLATVNSDPAKSGLSEHPGLQVFKVDLTKEKEATDFAQRAIQEYGPIDAALLLAGGFAAGGIAETSAADLHGQIALNFETAFHITRPLFTHMKENKRGRIVFIGARPGILPAQAKNMVAYGLAKSLLFRLAEVLNEGAKGLDLNVSVVVPSTLDTPANRKAMPDANPDNWVSLSDLAGTLEFLVSEKSIALRETVLKVYNKA